MSMTCITGGKECTGCMACQKSDSPDDGVAGGEHEDTQYLIWGYCNGDRNSKTKDRQDDTHA